MRDEFLLNQLLEAETENAVLEILAHRGLLELKNEHRWSYLGNTPNNQSIVLAQQSNPAAALVEKYTNGVDAILLRQCRARDLAPRGPEAPQSMTVAAEQFFGDLADLTDDGRRRFAEDNLVLYATGGRARPSISIYDNGEGQLPDNFPHTFCSLIYGSSEGGYKGAIPFVQGRFNMGGTGVLQFCSDKRKLQLIVSRVPTDVARGDNHEWGYTLFCFFPSKQNPSWKYLVGPDGKILIAGNAPLGLLPKAGRVQERFADRANVS